MNKPAHLDFPKIGARIVNVKSDTVINDREMNDAAIIAAVSDGQRGLPACLSKRRFRPVSHHIDGVTTLEIRSGRGLQDFKVARPNVLTGDRALQCACKRIGADDAEPNGRCRIGER